MEIVSGGNAKESGVGSRDPHLDGSADGPNLDHILQTSSSREALKASELSNFTLLAVLYCGHCPVFMQWARHFPGVASPTIPRRRTICDR